MVLWVYQLRSVRGLRYGKRCAVKTMCPQSAG